MKRRALAAGIVLIVIAFNLLFPSTVPTVVTGMANGYAEARIPFLIGPYILYVALAAFIYSKGRLFEVLRDEVQEELQKQQMTSLTLAGFCFTSLGLLISFFKEEIKSHQPGPEIILTFFAVALGSFIASYMVLRYRGQRIYSLVSDASLDNGMWCVLAGLLLFCYTTPGLERLPSVFAAVMAAYIVYVGLNVYFYVEFIR
jgi:hypothetical protein